MNFMSEVSSCASRPIEAMVRINEIDSAKSIADLTTSYSVTWAELQTNYGQVVPKAESSFKKKLQKTLSHGKASCMGDLREFQVSDTDESFLDLNEILKDELKNDKVQSLCTRWDETILAMNKQTDEQILENLCSFQQSQQLEPLLSLYIQDTVEKNESRDCTRLNKWWSDT